MENETEKIFTEQLVKLPQEVVTFISSTNWDTDLDEIGELYNLTPKEILAFKRGVTLVLAGIVHPDALMQMLDQEVGIKGAVLEALVANVEKKIFSTIRPALISFFEKEVAENTEIASVSPSAVRTLVPPPDNLPTDIVEIEPITPLVVSQIVTPSVVSGQMSVVPPVPQSVVSGQSSVVPPTVPPVPPSHPFEEKMKRVFTAGNQNMQELIIKTPETTSVVSGQLSAVPLIPLSIVNGQMSVVPPSDPYREPIE